MIADCETCDRKQVPCTSCETSQRAICFICQGDVADPYGELDQDQRSLAKQMTAAIAPLFPPACDARTEIAIGLWHKFANASHVEWENESHKAEYLMAVDGITTEQIFNLLFIRMDRLTAAIALLRDGLSGMAPDERMRWKVRVEAFLNRDQHTPQLNQPYR